MKMTTNQDFEYRELRRRLILVNLQLTYPQNISFEARHELARSDLSDNDMEAAARVLWRIEYGAL